MGIEYQIPSTFMVVDRMLQRPSKIMTDDSILPPDTVYPSSAHGPGDSTIATDSSKGSPDMSIFTPESDPIYDTLHPDTVLVYYNEAALSAKKRTSLPDDAFGLPRTRQYPLTDKNHVRQAIRMFGRCRSPKDRKILAANILAAIEKFGMDVKIGTSNPLYKYVPESLQESPLPQLTLDGTTTPMTKRTKEEVVKEHLRVNGTYYNNIFYGEDYRTAVTALSKFAFMRVFYPNFTRMNFVTRLKCVCGGLASPEYASQIYQELQLRSPTELDFNKPLGWREVATETDADSVAQMLISSNYDVDSNWFKVDLSDDLVHIFYCLRLYSVMGEIFLDPNFDPEVNLSPEHIALLSDWYQHVSYHYELHQDAETEDAKMRERQYLLDLFWMFTDHPDDSSVATVNVISMLRNMACVHDQVINMNEANTPGELITKDQCSAYLVHDLGLTDDLFLIPSMMQYPIIDKDSVRLAMDMITQISPDHRDEFVSNLNRKYKEFGCNFSITVDHPYAKYADKAIIANMTRVLMEGETAVDDEGTSTGYTNKVEQPFYKRIDYRRGEILKNLATVPELGPNTKQRTEPNDEPQQPFD